MLLEPQSPTVRNETAAEKIWMLIGGGMARTVRAALGGYREELIMMQGYNPPLTVNSAHAENAVDRNLSLIPAWSRVNAHF
jgi:hypothetical protein